MEALYIRRADESDIPLLAAQNIAMALETEGKRLDARTVRAGVAKGLARPDLCRYFVAERGGEAVGQLMVTYEWSDWRAGVFWWIQSVYVRPDARRHGVFRALYEHVASCARRDPEVCGLRLYVEQDNEQAKAVYEHLGLRASGHLVYEYDWSGANGIEKQR